MSSGTMRMLWLLGAGLAILLAIMVLSACDPASTQDDSRDRVVSTARGAEPMRTEQQWMYKKFDQIGCRLDRLEGKQSGDTACH